MKDALTGSPETKQVIYPPWRYKGKIYTNIGSIIGSLAACAIRQSPHPVPDKLSEALLGCREEIKKYLDANDFEREKFLDLKDNPGDDEWFHQTCHEIMTMLTVVFENVPEIMAWNTTKNEQNGIPRMNPMSRPSPDDDFIDLGAMARNVSHLLVTEHLVWDHVEGEGDENQTP